LLGELLKNAAPLFFQSSTPIVIQLMLKTWTCLSTLLFFQDSPDEWTIVKQPGQPAREGLIVVDLDHDHFLDLVMNGYVLFANNPRQGDYQKVVFDENWINKEGNLSNSTKNSYADLNGDGKKEYIFGRTRATEPYWKHGIHT